MDTDCDDVGAFAILLQAHLAGKIELIGVVADSVCRYAAPCCEVIAEHYGVKPSMGAVHFESYTTDERIVRFKDYLSLSATNLAKGKTYNKSLADRIEKNDKNYPSAAKIYRQLLSQAEDGSVTVVCVGMLTAVVEALCSTADEFSKLNGIELFRRKVKKNYNNGCSRKIGRFQLEYGLCCHRKIF